MAHSYSINGSILFDIKYDPNVCKICADVILEKFTAKEFWNNYREQLLTEENDHWKEVIETVKKTSPEYQAELLKYWD